MSIARPRLTYLLLFVVQAGLGWLALRAADASPYVLGLTVPVYVSGCLLDARPRWTVGLTGASWLALLVSALTTPIPVPLGELASLAGYVGGVSLVAVGAHVRRFGLRDLERRTRAELEQERRRTHGALARLEQLSHEDPLTGLVNRRRWDVEFSAVCAAARENGQTVSLVLVDLDHVRRINERHGHGAGDDALRAVANLLRSRVRGGDLVARLGGDELAVLLPGTDLGRARALAEALRREAALLTPAGLVSGELTLSLGVSTASGPRAYPLELMSCAEAQLFCAKITRNSVGGSGSAFIPSPRLPVQRTVEPAR